MNRKRLVLDNFTISKKSVIEQLILNLTIKNVAPITIIDIIIKIIQIKILIKMINANDYLIKMLYDYTITL